MPLNNHTIGTILQYINLTLSTIGIPFNFFAFAVFHFSPKFQKHKFTIFFKALVIFDIFTLLHSYRYFMAFNSNINIESGSPILCKLLEYSNYVFDSTSTWIFGVILVERLVTISYPSHRHWFTSKSNQILIISSIILFSLFYYITIPLFRVLIRNNFDNSTICNYSDRTHALVVYLTDFSNIVISSLIFNNMVTIATIVCVYRSRRRAISSQTKQRKIIIRDRKFAITSIVMDFVLFLCEMPVMSLLVVSNYVGDESGMLFSIGYFFFALKCSSCFWINLVANSIFRNEFFRIFKIDFKNLNPKEISTF